MVQPWHCCPDRYDGSLSDLAEGGWVVALGVGEAVVGGGEGLAGQRQVQGGEGDPWMVLSLAHVFPRG